MQAEQRVDTLEGELSEKNKLVEGLRAFVALDGKVRDKKVLGSTAVELSFRDPPTVATSLRKKKCKVVVNVSLDCVSA